MLTTDQKANLVARNLSNLETEAYETLGIDLVQLNDLATKAKLIGILAEDIADMFKGYSTYHKNAEAIAKGCDIADDAYNAHTVTGLVRQMLVLPPTA